MRNVALAGFLMVVTGGIAGASSPATQEEMQYVQALYMVGKSAGDGFAEFEKTKGGNPTLSKLLAATAACHIEEIESWDLPHEEVRDFKKAMVGFLWSCRSLFEAWAAGEVGRAGELGSAAQDAWAAVEAAWKELEPRYEPMLNEE